MVELRALLVEVSCVETAVERARLAAGPRAHAELMCGNPRALALGNWSAQPWSEDGDFAFRIIPDLLLQVAAHAMAAVGWLAYGCSAIRGLPCRGASLSSCFNLASIHVNAVCSLTGLDPKCNEEFKILAYQRIGFYGRPSKLWEE